MNTILHWMSLPLRALAHFFNHVNNARDIEEYLGQSTDHADLERRLNNLRYGNHFDYNRMRGSNL